MSFSIFFMTVVAVVSLVGLSACSLKSQLDDMHDKTAQMADTTKKMSDTTAGMSTTTNHMDKTTTDLDNLTKQVVSTSDGLFDVTKHVAATSDGLFDLTQHVATTSDGLYGLTQHVSTTSDGLYDLTKGVSQTARFTYNDMRGGAAKDLRDKTFFNVMVSNPEMPVKLEAASTFIYSFEFQAWKGVGDDTPEKLNNEKQLAALEFFEMVQKFTVHKFAALPMPDSLMDFYALSAVCHLVYPEQEDQANAVGFPTTSVYSIIEEGLRAQVEKPDWDPKDMPLYIYYVQHFAQIAKRVIEARVTYIPFQIYAELNNLNEASNMAVARRAFTDNVKKWDLNLYDSKAGTSNVEVLFPSLLDAFKTRPMTTSITNITRFNEYLTYALKSRRLLADLGISYLPDNSKWASLGIRNIWGHVRYTDKPDPSEPQSAIDLQTKKIKLFKGYMHLLFAPQSEFMKADPQYYAEPVQ